MWFIALSMLNIVLSPNLHFPVVVFFVHAYHWLQAQPHSTTEIWDEEAVSIKLCFSKKKKKKIQNHPITLQSQTIPTHVYSLDYNTVQTWQSSRVESSHFTLLSPHPLFPAASHALWSHSAVLHSDPQSWPAYNTLPYRADAIRRITTTSITTDTLCLICIWKYLLEFMSRYSTTREGNENVPLMWHNQVSFFHFE